MDSIRYQFLQVKSEFFPQKLFCISSGNNVRSTQSIEKEMRKRLRFFFMNPIEKWQARQRFPHKCVIQIVKVFLVTINLWLFARNNYIHVNYAWNNKIAFSHLFLQGWCATQEVPAHPPATGPFALFEKAEHFETIGYAVEDYYNMSDAISSYSYPFRNNTGLITLGLYKLATFAKLCRFYNFFHFSCLKKISGFTGCKGQTVRMPPPLQRALCTGWWII